MLALMEACLSGTQYVYQGQEIGCVNVPKETYPVENYLDIETILFLEMTRELHGADNKEELDKAFSALQYLARDHSRVPMAWNGKAKFGGFSEAAERAGLEVKEPWMKPHPLAGEINVASQLDDAESVLAFWRKVLRFRKEHADLLIYGDYRGLRPQDKDVFLFVKEHVGGGDKVVVLLNFTADERTVEMPSTEELGMQIGELVPIMSTHRGKTRESVLAPFEGRVLLATAAA
jgi:alpha-glucosidase